MAPTGDDLTMQQGGPLRTEGFRSEELLDTARSTAFRQDPELCFSTGP